MIDKNKHINYTAADIQRYLKGGMSVEEMHALEKAALDDPFLADAIEGMDTAIKQHGEVSVAAGLTELKKQFEQKPEEKPKVIPMKPAGWFKWAAAAMIIITGGAVALNYWQKTDEPNDQLAVTETKKEKEIPSQAKAENDSISSYLSNGNANLDSQVANKSTVPVVARQKSTQPSGTITSQREVSDAAVVSEVAADKNDDETATKQKENVAALAKPKKDSTATTATEEVAIVGDAYKTTNQNKAPIKNDNEVSIVSGNIKNDQGNAGLSQLNNFRGQVLDSRSNPLSFATIQLRNNTDRGLVTDKLGNFEIKSNDSTLDVSITSVGYEEQNVRLRNDITMNKVVLTPSQNAMNEVVVVEGYGTRRAKKEESGFKKPTVMVQNAEPNGGWMKYQQYIDSNKNKQLLIADITGEVVVSFQVDRAGILSDFKIEKSLTPQYNEEAVRLIKQGPSWKLLKGRKARATVIIRF